jgi:hypothetical protein
MRGLGAPMNSLAAVTPAFAIERTVATGYAWCR